MPEGSHLSRRGFLRLTGITSAVIALPTWWLGETRESGWLYCGEDCQVMYRVVTIYHGENRVDQHIYNAAGHRISARTINGFAPPSFIIMDDAVRLRA